MKKKYTYYLLTGVITFLFITLIFINPYPLISINLKLTDFMMAHRVYNRLQSDVVVVAIDEKSLEEIGRWPWNRATLGSIVNNLRAAHPSAIGIDIVFSEPQHDKVRHLLMNINQELDSISQTGKVRKDIKRMLAQMPDPDTVLANSISKAGDVVLGYFFYMSKNQLPMFLNITDTSFAFSQISSSKLPVIKTGIPAMKQAYFPVADVSKISSASHYKGFFNMFPDPDGVVRNYTLVQTANDKTFPSLGLLLASIYTGMQPLVTEDSTGIASIKLLPSSGKALRIPVDNYGRMLINYPPPEYAVPMLSAVDVLENKFDHKLVANKVVLIGPTAPGLYDLRVTPISNALPGIFIHAYAVEQLINRRFITNLAQNPLMNVLLILFITIVLIIGMNRISSLLFLVKLAVLLIGFIFTVFLLLSFTSVVLNITYPILSIVSYGIVLSSYKYTVEEKKGREIKKAFSRYVSPTVVGEIIKAPKSLKWGGERKDVSILFSDIRGFTKLSTYLKPEQIALLLHEYMTAMTGVILNHAGMLDKYIGDAIMALFGTPLSMPDHAEKAVLCGIEMQTILKDVNKKLSTLNLPSISIGIGINSGDAVVGNMGSEMLFDYTAVGDNVNIASRLEGLNKYYGTNLLVSEFTYNQLSSKDILFKLDRVIPSGADTPIYIYTLLPDGISNADEFKAIYEEALSVYVEGRFYDAASVFAKAGNDYPFVKTMIDRCRVLNKDTWEGFYRFEKK